MIMRVFKAMALWVAYTVAGLILGSPLLFGSWSPNLTGGDCPISISDSQGTTVQCVGYLYYLKGTARVIVWIVLLALAALESAIVVRAEYSKKGVQKVDTVFGRRDTE
jgi:hypothetical protein